MPHAKNSPFARVRNSPSSAIFRLNVQTLANALQQSTSPFNAIKQNIFNEFMLPFRVTLLCMTQCLISWHFAHFYRARWLHAMHNLPRATDAHLCMQMQIVDDYSLPTKENLDSDGHRRYRNYLNDSYRWNLYLLLFY